MRTALAVAFVVALAAPAMAKPLAVEFSTPANYNANSTAASGATWALLVFDVPEAQIDLEVTSGAMVENTTWIHPVKVQSAVSEYDPVGHPETSYSSLNATGLSLHPRSRSSIFVVADEVRLMTTGTKGTMDDTGIGRTLADFSRSQDDREQIHRRHGLPDNQVVVTYSPLDGTAPFELMTAGPKRVEWFAVDANCQSSQGCADAGGAHVEYLPGALGHNITSESYSYQAVTSLQAAHGSGTLSYAVLGGPTVSLAMEGLVRLPLATTAEQCNCPGPDGQTATLEGRLQVEGLHVVGPGRIATAVDGKVDAARFDEVPIDPKMIGLGFTALTVAVAGVVVGKAMLAFLFTKFRESDVLLSPRRKAIYEAVLASPGIGFRELSRATGVLPTAVRHHLGVLIRHKKIVERSHGYSLRYFENHGKFDKNWRLTAVLRDDNLAVLYEWVASRGPINQKAVLDEWETRGWSRSSTQHRLGRLEANGMIGARRHGRLKVYEAFASEIKRMGGVPQSVARSASHTNSAESVNSAPVN